MNVELLLQVKAAILEEPKRLHMGYFVADHVYADVKEYPVCDTVCANCGRVHRPPNRNRSGLAQSMGVRFYF